MGYFNDTWDGDDALKIDTTLMKVWDFGIANSSYMGIPINEEICPYKITVYPAESAMELFLSNSDNIVFNLLVIILSVTVLTIDFTLFLFTIYSRFVQNEIKAKIAMQQQQTQRYHNVFERGVVQTIKIKTRAKQLSPELLKAQFATIDGDTSGDISKDELWKFLSNVKAGTINESGFNALLVVIDINDSGTIDSWSSAHSLQIAMMNTKLLRIGSRLLQPRIRKF